MVSLAAWIELRCPCTHMCTLSAQTFQLDEHFKASTFLLWFLLPPQKQHLSSRSTYQQSGNILGLDEPFKTSLFLPWCILINLLSQGLFQDHRSLIWATKYLIWMSASELTDFFYGFPYYIRSDCLRAPAPHISDLGIQILDADEHFKLRTASF